MAGHRRLLVLFIALAGLVLGTAPARAVDPGAAGALVTHAVDDAITTFSGRKMSREERAKAARDLMGRYSDLRLISATILGRYWTSASADQQAKFPPLLVEYALSAWAPMGDLGAGDSKIRVSGTEPAGDRLTVHALAGAPGEQPTPLDFTVAGEGGKLVITDVVVDHVSFITTMRDDFTSFLRSNGGRLDALMAAMQKKIDANAVATAK